MRPHTVRRRARELVLLLLLTQALERYQVVHSGRILKEEDEQQRLAQGAEPGGTLFALMSSMVPPERALLTEHFAQTEDGCVLRIFRLQRPAAAQGGATQQERRVVFVQHALLDSSLGWLLLGPDNSLPFMLLDAGFDDVFLGNLRGNRFSRNSTVLDPDVDAKFWRFSYDQHAELDVPAMVSEALRVSGASSLQFVGYSQGSLVLLAGLSSRPELAKAVRSAVLLAPAVFVGHISSLPFRTLAHLQTAEVFQRWGVTEFGAHDPTAAEVAARACAVLPSACRTWLQFLCGANPQGNLQVVEAVMRHLPAGTSTQNMAHWGQAVRQAGAGPLGLRKFDYGTTCPPSLPSSSSSTSSSSSSSSADSAAAGIAWSEATDGAAMAGDRAWARVGASASSASGVTAARARGAPSVTGSCNQVEYGQLEPPSYNFSAIGTPLVLFSGGHDTLATPVDVGLLLEALPRRAVHAAHTIPNYAHLDFGLGEDAHWVLYPSIIAALGDLELRTGWPVHDDRGPGADAQGVAAA